VEIISLASKKDLNVETLLYAARNIVDQFIKGSNTANFCAIDMSKAFDKTNHHALFVKLMKTRDMSQLNF